MVVDGLELPPGLCWICSDAAVNAYKYRRLCMESYEKWHQAVDSIALIDDPIEDDKTYYIFYNEGVKTIIRDQISRVANVSEVIQRIAAKPNVDKEHKRKFRKCKCPDCNRVFSSPFFLNRHLKATSKGACEECGLVLPKTALEKHFAQHEDQKIDNSMDGEDMITKWQSPNDCVNPNACSICGSTFSNDRGLRAHMYSHTLFHCTGCSRSFENRGCFNYHQKSCSDTNLTNVKKRRGNSKDNGDLCDDKPDQLITFSEKSKKDRADADDSKFKVFICGDCGAEYDKKPSLKMHMIQKHLRVLPYVCQTCGKRTSTQAHMRSHQSVHAENRPVFMCHCGAQMRTLVGFQLHQRIHSGEKPYQCKECGECFLSASRRLDHVKRRHRSAQDMPHACSMCSAKFIRPFELKKHYKVIHYTDVNVKPAERKPRLMILGEYEVSGDKIQENYEIEEFSEESLCPPGVCVSCTSAAVSAQQFRTLVHTSRSTWSKLVENIDQLPSHASLCPNQSIKSVYAYIQRDSAFLRIVNNYEDDAKAAINKLTRTPQKKKVEKKPRYPRTGPPCDCTDCGTHFLGPYYLNMHLKNSGQKDSCLTCGAIVLRGQEMKDHLEMVHKRVSFLCSNCPALFEKESELKKHRAIAHKPGALTCGDCGRNFPRSETFEAHSQMHAVRTCRNCGAQFTNRGCYRKHRTKCEPTAKPDTQLLPRSKRSNIRDPATFICDYCNKTYHSRPQLKNHILWIHLDVRPHQCQWCGKRFYTPARLLEHTVVHTRVRNFECDICGAKLVSKMAAVYHRRRHTGERPYECVDCGEKFISASRRSEHAKRRHNKGTRLQCKQCVATFVRGHELKKHEDRAHKAQELKPFSVTAGLKPV